MSGLVRQCEACGAEYRRPTGSSKISDGTWSQRRYCSSACGMRATGQHMRGGGQIPVEEVARQSARIGSENLLVRMRRVYARVALERGLDDIWQAAVVLGMAA